MSKVTDNVELDFPARMSDGRQFTDYRQNCLLNNNLSQGKGSWEYRNYLTQNAVQLQQQMIQQVYTIFVKIYKTRFRKKILKSITIFDYM